MTTPNQQPGDGSLSAVLIKLGEMGAQLAAIDERLKAVPDHETRIRALERFRYRAAGAGAGAGVITGVLSGIAMHLMAHVR